MILSFKLDPNAHVISDMSLGYDRETNIFNLGDTGEIFASLYDSEDFPISGDDIVSVEFTVQKPDKTKEVITGEVMDDGVGRLLYDGTDQKGQYITIAAFQLIEGIRSVRSDFEVVDPFEDLAPSPSWVVADAAWAKIEDCFDGEDEGPWLRDMTLNFFNRKKMEEFLAEALFDINAQNPPTDVQLDAFAYSSDGSTYASKDLPLASQAVFVCVLRHLIRSYVEQPNPVGAQIAWHDRRDYLQRWQSVYQLEWQQYLRMLALWKRQFLGLGHSKVLVSSKAGRLIPAPMRTRNVGRGYW